MALVFIRLRETDVPRFAHPGATGPWRRAFTLVEILVAIVIVMILVGLTVAVIGPARESGKRITCLSNLHQLGLALEVYRSDWEDRKPVDNLLKGGGPWKRQAWVSLKPYVDSEGVFRCSEDPRQSYERLGYIYRAFIPDLTHNSFRVPLGTEASSMSVWCQYHLDRKTIHAPFGDLENPVLGPDGHYKGTFVFLRNDASAAKANAKAVDTYVSDGTNWYVLGTEPAGFTGPIRTERFPGEPWPPEFQR